MCGASIGSAMPADRLARLRRSLAFRPALRWWALSGDSSERKGLLELFAAVAQMRGRHPDLRFLVVGPVDRDMPDTVGPAAAASAGIGDITVFAGYRDDMPDLYALMTVLVLPSHREGLPRSPMEASSMGVPDRGHGDPRLPRGGP